MAKNWTRNSAGNGKSIGLIGPMDGLRTKMKIPRRKIREKLTSRNRRNRGTRKFVVEGLTKAANSAREPD